jgi:DNA-binding NarL/FixJ family response regulator
MAISATRMLALESDFILVLEPDFERGERLKQLICERVDAEVVVVPSARAAIAAMSSQIPDVILTSVLLPPRDDAQLRAHLKQLDTASEPRVLMLPLASDPGEFTSASRRGRFTFFGRRFFARCATPLRPAYDRSTIGAQIETALEQSRRTRSRCLTRLPENSMNHEADQASVTPANVPPILQPVAARSQRARRWAPADLPWLGSVQTAWGQQVRVLNISGSGMLVESSSKLAPGSSTEFSLSGPGTEVVMPARVVRSEVAAVDGRGVKYQTATVFERGLDHLFREEPESATGLWPTPLALVDLLLRVSTEIGSGRDAVAVRATFEQGLRQLVPAREIRIRDVPIAPIDGSESIYFTVPDGGASRSILQATFEPNYELAADEFTLLKAAAAAAAIVLLYERRPSMVVAQSA